MNENTVFEENHAYVCSVIIPVYNTDRALLDRCLKSFEGLGDGFQRLLIDDGSGEETAGYLDAYCAERDHYSCIHQMNAGVSAARNTGIRHAAGEWIVFCDADDEADPGTLLAWIGPDPETDLICFDYEKNGRTVSYVSVDADGDADCFLRRVLCRPNLYGTVWAKAFRRSVIAENGLRFDARLRFSEDTEFLLRYLGCCRRVRHVPACGYRYYQSDRSGKIRCGEAVREYRRALLTIRRSLDSRYDRLYGNLCNVNLLILLVNYICSEDASVREQAGLLKRLTFSAPFCGSLKCYDAEECSAAERAVIALLSAGQFAQCVLLGRARYRMR